MERSPIIWKPPATFDENAPGLGMPQLEGISHRIIYDPVPSNANVDEGGNGVYESPNHGMFCHGPSYIIYGEHIIGSWSNHTHDEAGPGGRKIARVGTFRNNRDEIDWGGLDTLVALIDPVIPPKRRHFQCDPKTLYPYIGAGLQLINGSFYVTGGLLAACGYTTQEQYRLTDGPIPAEGFSDGLDIDAGYGFDKWAPLGLSFVQKWRLDKGKLRPDSPLYQRSPAIMRYEVTPGRFKEVVPLQPPYTDMIPFEKARQSIRDDILKGEAPPKRVRPRFAPGTQHLSADGKHALAHMAEYQRPDGKWVSIRDNLLVPGHYYAAVTNDDGSYPPAAETNLYGGANIAAGTLPDGRIYIICNSYDDYYRAKDRSRKDMFMVLSKDGVTFDQTWLLLHIDRTPTLDGVYKFGGPQYFKPAIIARNMWIFYSITKEKIGLTKIPLEVLT